MEWHRTPPYGRRTRAPFALIVAITACGTLGMHLIIPALPDTARSLGVSAGTIQLTITPDPTRVGSKVSGYVYVDTYNTFDAHGIGDEVASLPYAYTVAP